MEKTKKTIVMEDTKARVFEEYLRHRGIPFEASDCEDNYTLIWVFVDDSETEDCNSYLDMLDEYDS